MLRSRVRVLTIACISAAAVLSTPAWSAACPFGCCGPCAMPVAAPACTTCAPQTVQYMPTAYRALYAPAVVTPVRAVQHLRKLRRHYLSAVVWRLDHVFGSIGAVYHGTTDL